MPCNRSPEGWCLLPGVVPGPRGVPAPWGVCSWGRGVCSGGVPGKDPPGTATAVGGTHPTGMHSCFKEVHFLRC